MCVCVCVCIYIYIYTHTHTHTHTNRVYPEQTSHVVKNCYITSAVRILWTERADIIINTLFNNTGYTRIASRTEVVKTSTRQAMHV